MKKILPLFLLILVLSSSYLFKTSFYKTYSIKKKFSDKKVLYILLFIGIYCLIWFLKFPVYRFGLSFISSFLIFSFIFFIVDSEKKIINKKYLFSFLVFGIFIFYSKNLNRIIKNFDNYYINSPWPAIYSMKKEEKNEIKEFKKIFDEKGNFKYFYSGGEECMYSRSPCSNYFIHNLKIRTIYKYKIFYIN